MLKHRLRLFNATVSPAVCFAAGTWTPNKDHDATQDATTHYPDQKEIRKIEKNKIYSPKKRMEKVDITDMCSTDDESGDGQSTKSKDDVDSEVTFEEDSDEEMDATTIEEEDWILHKEKHC